MDGGDTGGELALEWVGEIGEEEEEEDDEGIKQVWGLIEEGEGEGEGKSDEVEGEWREREDKEKEGVGIEGGLAPKRRQRMIEKEKTSERSSYITPFVTPSSPHVSGAVSTKLPSTCTENGKI